MFWRSFARFSLNGLRDFTSEVCQVMFAALGVAEKAMSLIWDNC
jgi:hypothetical protein